MPRKDWNRDELGDFVGVYFEDLAAKLWKKRFSCFDLN